MRAVLVAVLTFSVVAGGAKADAFSKFYKATTGDTYAVKPFSGEPKFYPFAGDGNAAIIELWRERLGIIGLSQFEGAPEDPKGALKLAKKLKAKYVVLVGNPTTVDTGVEAVQSPTTVTTTVQGSLGRGFGVPFQSTATSRGSQTEYVPYSQQRYSQAALFFADADDPIGILPYPLTDEDRAALETNRGFRVHSVQNRSPAFDADVLAGDIVYKLDGEPFDAGKFGQAVSTPGAKLRLGIMRKGQYREVTMTMPGGAP